MNWIVIKFTNTVRNLSSTYGLAMLGQTVYKSKVNHTL